MKTLKLFRLVLLLAIPMVVVVSSCHDSRFFKYKIGVTIYNGSGMSSGYSSVLCDSVKMISIKEADVFIDGVKTRLIATDYIAVWSNTH